MSQSIDTFGVPEYYSDHIGALEDAGNGLIRIVRCIERNGVLIPVFSFVTPAISILRDAPRFRTMANKVAGMEGVCRN
jgi:hypothetical protein